LADFGIAKRGFSLANKNTQTRGTLLLFIYLFFLTIRVFQSGFGPWEVIEGAGFVLFGFLSVFSSGFLKRQTCLHWAALSSL
jgi:hypothetical protein